ncbi:MAG TPA: adenylate/guanylate cyclase domain-containing protein [Micromonosporaceae bacterium]|nr:adenylate/guanylate cyclase domain-containing protein [Micromonosporaceae bacterium]
MLLVSLAFLCTAGFLLLHALATPGVLLTHPNVGFDLAQPVGLAIAAVFTFASSLPLAGVGATAVVRAAPTLRTVLVAVLLGWAAVSLLDLPPLNRPPQVRELHGPLVAIAIGAVALYLATALRYYRQHRQRPGVVLLSIITASVLLAEAMVAVTLADKWHLSWWEWHVLLTFAFGYVAYSAYVQYRREGTSAGLFDAITLAQTERAIRAEYEAALEELVTALERGQPGGRVAERFGLSEGQAAVLDRAGTSLAAERDVSRRLAALVAVGDRARVGLTEEDFLSEAQSLVQAAFGDVHIGLGGRHAAPPGDGRVAYPLTVKGHLAGVLDLPESGDPAIAAALAHQLSIALENARLYRELGTLFRQYLSPDVAAALLADPDQAALGGSVVDVTALFADLRGFTTFSEGVAPAEIVRMLNRYHGVAVPCILHNGGTIVQFVGDALLALFNAPARQPDHAARAVRAALDMQAAVERIAAGQPGWPRFRVGANTGPALVGNIGSDALRGFNAMGDAVNVAARLQTLAEPGQVVIGEATRQAIGATVEVRPLGELAVKGRRQPVLAYVVTGLGV